MAYGFDAHLVGRNLTAVPIACRYCLRVLLPTPGGIKRYADPGLCESCGRGVYSRYATQ